MNILFIGCLYSSEAKSYYLRNSKRGYQSAAQNLQEALLEGFLQNGTSVRVLTIPSLSTFPIGYKKIVVRSRDYIYIDRKFGRSFGFPNLPFFNHVNTEAIDQYVDKWYDEAVENRNIFVYALLGRQMSIAVRAKERHPDIKISIIVPDLPMYMNCNKVYKMLGLQDKSINHIRNMIPMFDSFVLLAEPMANQLSIADKPYCVVEGIYNALIDQNSIAQKFDGKTLLYSGSIQSRYGVFDLVEAFHRIQGEDYKLILCGPCLEMEKLNEYLSSDKRIQYLGVISTEDVRRLQKQVTLLVNPRHSTEEFTKFSFPSKTLEYMASGTPVLMSKLPSMPDEYLNHVFIFDDESVDGMMKKIVEVCEKPTGVLAQTGVGAKNLVTGNKTPKVQAQKILQLMQTI